jgi:hypothetical protein
MHCSCTQKLFAASIPSCLRRLDWRTRLWCETSHRWTPMFMKNKVTNQKMVYYVLYWTGFRYNLYKIVLTWDDTSTVSIYIESQSNLINSQLYLRFMQRVDGSISRSYPIFCSKLQANLRNSHAQGKNQTEINFEKEFWNDSVFLD